MAEIKQLGMRSEMSVKVVELQESEISHKKVTGGEGCEAVVVRRQSVSVRNRTMPETEKDVARRTTRPLSSSTRTVGMPLTP